MNTYLWLKGRINYERQFSERCICLLLFQRALAVVRALQCGLLLFVIAAGIGITYLIFGRRSTE